MANWLQKILPPAPPGGRNPRNLPTDMKTGGPLARPSPRMPKKPAGLPNASIIYGIAASMLFVISLYFILFDHKFVPGVLVMLLATCFLGFALHFLKYPQ